MAFHWDRISNGLARDLARAAGLRSSLAVQELSATFGKIPRDNLVEVLWPTLRDRWLGANPVPRDRVVRDLREANLGDGTIKISTKAGQMQYLRSCRQSARLRTIVLKAFLDEEPQAEIKSAANEGISNDPKVLVRLALETMNILQETAFELALATNVNQFLREFRPPQPTYAAEGAKRLAGCLVRALAMSMEPSEPAEEPVAPHRIKVVEGAHRLARADTWELVDVFLGIAHKLLEDPKGDAQRILLTSVRGALTLIASAISVPTADLQQEIAEGTKWLTMLPNTLARRGADKDEAVAATGTTAAPTDQHGSVRDRVVALLNDVLGSPPVFDADGDVPIGKGSARLYIRVLEEDIPVPVVQIAGKLVQGVKPTHEVLTDVNEASMNLYFSRIVCRKDGVFLEGNIPAETLSSRELAFLVHEAVSAADHFDSLLASRHEGSTLGTDPGELLDV